MNYRITNSKPFEGEYFVPGDKSISHRFAMLGAIAGGKSECQNFLNSEDCINTVRFFEELGVKYEVKDSSLIVHGKSVDLLQKPERVLYVGNSGTTMRLASGIIASSNIECIIDGDESIRKRPMSRVINPLRQMGACISSINGTDTAPIHISGSLLNGIEYSVPIASAQVKSALLLAGINASGKTVVIENRPTRNHTELMLKNMGADIKYENNIIKVAKSHLKPIELFIPGDFSSAAFLIAAALIIKGSEIKIKNVGLNHTRTGLIRYLQKMGAKIEVQEYKNFNFEKLGEIKVSYSDLKGIIIEDITDIIDEIPVLSVLAAFSDGVTLIKNASELRVKESDRIKSILYNLKIIGVETEEYEDGFKIKGNPQAHFEGCFESFGDHRIAMAFTCAALKSNKPCIVQNIECINTSFPNFYNYFKDSIEII